MKYLLSLILLVSLSNASMLLDKKNLCIEDYYVTNDGYFHFLKSSTGRWNSVTSTNYAGSVLYGYDYNSSDNSCRRNANNITASNLGLSYQDYGLIMALSAVLFSSIVIFFLTSFLIGF